MKIGIDIGGSHIGVGLIDNIGKIIKKIDIDHNTNNIKENYNEILVNTIINQISLILEKSKTDITKISLIGIASPGTVSNTHIVKAENLNIKNLDIVSQINKYYNIPIQLKNDAKCAALAEKRYGSLKKAEDAIFLTLGTGIGGAVFLQGNLLKPKNIDGFEIGHMVIQKNGIQCNCGKKGCFEKYASMKALKDKIVKELKIENLSVEKLRNILENQEEDKKIQSIIDEYIENLGLGIGNLINIFEPEIISIGGSFAYYKDILLDKLNKELHKENMLFNSGTVPKIVTAKLKNDAGIIGSVL